MNASSLSAGKRDPLLIAARVIAIVLIVIMAIAIGALAIAAPAVVVKQADVLAELTAEGYVGSGAIVWAIAGIILLAIVPLALIITFLRTGIAMIDTVAAGDPFVPDNAQRLSRMGWLVLAVQASALPIGALAVWLGQRVPQADIDADFDVSGSGLILALVLFILARIFRHGAAMREELEGTV